MLCIFNSTSNLVLPSPQIGEGGGERGLAVNAALNKTFDPTFLLSLHCCLPPSSTSHFSLEMNAHLQAEWNPYGLYLKL